MWNDPTNTAGRHTLEPGTIRSGRASTSLHNGGELERQVRRFSMKKLTLASVALYALLGITDMVFAQSDPDPVEPDTPGSCGDGDVGDSFATAYDLGNAGAWPGTDKPDLPGEKKRTVVSDFECSGDLDVYRFEVSSLVRIAHSVYDKSPLPQAMELYDSGGNFVGFNNGAVQHASLLPGIYYVAVATQLLAEHRTETGRYEFSLLYELLIPEIQPTTVRSPGGPAAVLLNLSPWQAWVHLYCQKDRPASDDAPASPCTVRFECNGMSGEPASWTVDIAPKTIFSYWPTKMVDGTSANLQAALWRRARRRTKPDAGPRAKCSARTRSPCGAIRCSAANRRSFPSRCTERHRKGKQKLCPQGHPLAGRTCLAISSPRSRSTTARSY